MIFSINAPMFIFWEVAFFPSFSSCGVRTCQSGLAFSKIVTFFLISCFVYKLVCIFFFKNSQDFESLTDQNRGQTWFQSTSISIQTGRGFWSNVICLNTVAVIRKLNLTIFWKFMHKAWSKWTTSMMSDKAFLKFFS